MLLVFAPVYLEFAAPASPAAYEWLLGSEPLTNVLALGLLIFVVFACHRWLPKKTRSVKELWPGIGLTLLLWMISAQLFSYYVRTFANYGATYAGLAGIMTALIFLYLMAVILIFGAELNAAIERQVTE